MEKPVKVGVRWKSRGSYGRMLHKIIKKLFDKIDKEEDIEKCLNLARTAGYLVSVVRELIKDEAIEEIEKRLARLEKELRGSK